jgi:hypothetical protein
MRWTCNGEQGRTLAFGLVERVEGLKKIDIHNADSSIFNSESSLSLIRVPSYNLKLTLESDPPHDG